MKLYTSTLILFLSIVTVGNVYAIPRISISVDQVILISGESAPKISVAATNDVIGNYDVHIGVISPEGTIYEYPDWNTNLKPWLKNFEFPTGFQLPITEITDMSTFPFDFDPGIWQAAVALTEPGTLNIVAFATSACAAVDRNIDGNITIGTVLLSHSKINGGLSVSEDLVTAGASFSLIELDPSALNSQIDSNLGTSNDSNFTIPEINQCVFNRIDIPPIIDNPEPTDITIQGLDAGDITISSATQPFLINKNLANDFIIYTGSPDPSFYQEGVVYTAEGTGSNELSHFKTSITGVKPIQLQNPSLNQTTIQTGQDLNLIWNGNGGLGEIYATLAGVDSNGSSIIFCRFIDDGNGTINSNLLTQLKASLGTLTIGDFAIPTKATFVMTGRSDYKFFNTDALELDYGIFMTSSSISSSYDLE